VRFLITAGPTREPIDPVRYISNRSSGKMGYAIADAALEAGHDVILISGPVNLAPPSNAKFVSVSTSDEMFDAMHRYADSCDVCVLCAAVADYKPAKASPTKIKKRDERFSLELVRTRDILESLGQQRDRPFLLVGFAAETNDVKENAEAKRRRKKLPLLVANRAQDTLGQDENEVTLLDDAGAHPLPRMDKLALARRLVAEIAARLSVG